MRRLVSNIILGVGTLLAALAKWGGRLMDLLDLPEFGKKWDEFWTKIGVDEFELWIFAAIVILLLLVNVPWRRVWPEVNKNAKVPSQDSISIDVDLRQDELATQKRLASAKERQAHVMEEKHQLHLEEIGAVTRRSHPGTPFKKKGD